MGVFKNLKKLKKVEPLVRAVIRAGARINPVAATKVIYFLTMEKKLNLKNPQTLNEKIQWLKLYKYQNDKLITQLVDKYRVREYLQGGGDGYLLNELYAVYDAVHEICVDSLPEQFVLKCNHDSGSTIICDNKDKFDFEMVKKKLEKCFHQDFWINNVEVQYRKVPKKIICERYLTSMTGELIDYKFFCFNGKPKLLYCQTTNDDGWENISFYDCNWNMLPIKRKGHDLAEYMERPNNFEEMFNIAEKLSEPFPFVRVDLYVVDEQIFFSEFTFVPTGGLMQFEDDRIDYELGKLLEIF